MIPGKAPDVVTQEEYRDHILETVCNASKNEDIVLFLDPIHQIHNNESGYRWQKRGKANTKIGLTNSGRRRLNIIGSIEPLSFRPVIVLTEANCNKELLSKYLEEVRKAYPQANKIHIFLDNAPYNKSYEVRDKAEELGIILHFLPPYSPNLNLIERLWKFFKKKVIKCHYYPTWEDFYQACFSFFENISDFSDELSSLLSLNFEIIKAS